MAWSNNNLAHRWLWWSLFLLEQSQKTFDNSAAVKMRQLAYWVDSDSAQMRRGKARSLAQVLDNMFVKIYKAKYESGEEESVARTKAVNAMVKDLIEADCTMEQLADTVDSCYRFEGEV